MKNRLLFLFALLASAPAWGQNASVCTTSQNIALQGQRFEPVFAITLTSGDTCNLNFAPLLDPNLAQTITLKFIQSSTAPYAGSIAGGNWPDGIPSIPQTAGAIVFATCNVDTAGAYCFPSSGGGGGGSGVNSFNTRTGAVTLSAADVEAVGPITNSTSGNAATATQLANAPSNCPTGEATTGVNASGAAQNCFTPAGSNPLTALGQIYGGGASGVPTAIPAASGPAGVPETLVQTPGSQSAFNAPAVTIHQLAAGTNTMALTNCSGQYQAATSLGSAPTLNLIATSTYVGCRILVTNNSAYSVTITSNGSDTITYATSGAQTSYTLASGNSAGLTAQSGNWLLTPNPATSGSQAPTSNAQWTLSAGSPGQGNFGVGSVNGIFLFAIPAGPYVTQNVSNLTFIVATADATSSHYYDIGIYGPCAPGASSCPLVVDLGSGSQGVNLPSTGVITLPITQTKPTAIPSPAAGQWYYIAMTGNATTAQFDSSGHVLIPVTNGQSTTASTNGQLPSSIEIPSANWNATNMLTIAALP